MAEGEVRNDPNVIIRPIGDFAELDACIELQRQAWGSSDLELIPRRVFITQNRIGGLVLGAFQDSRLVGFLNATPGIRANGMPYWYSQMLAVSRELRDRGVGAELKFAQRDHARRRGIRLIEWTFDPLESKNAYLNIVKLGVIVRRYHVNLYGSTWSQLQQGLESDRLVAEWWLDEPRPAVQRDVRRVSIPADIQSLKKRDLRAAEDAQRLVRRQFLENFQDGWFVAGFERRGESSEYVFIPGASDVHPKN